MTSEFQESDPAEVRHGFRIRIAALNLINAGISEHGTHRAQIEAAHAGGFLWQVPDLMFSIIRFYLRTLPDQLTIFDAAVATEEHEHHGITQRAESPGLAEELVINRILLLVRNAGISDEAHRRLTAGVQNELMIHTTPPPDSPEELM